MGLLSGQDDPRRDAASGRARFAAGSGGEAWSGRGANRQHHRREDSEPSTGEGRKELAAKAQGIEKHRDDRAAAKETYEFGSGALELGILLASSAIVTGLLPLAFIGGAFGIVGSALALLGWFAPHFIGG